MPQVPTREISPMMRHFATDNDAVNEDRMDML